MKLNQNSTLDLRDLEEQFSNQVRKNGNSLCFKSDLRCICQFLRISLVEIHGNSYESRIVAGETGILLSPSSWTMDFLTNFLAPFQGLSVSSPLAFSCPNSLCCGGFAKLTGPTMTAAKAPLWLWLLGLVAIALAQEKPEGALATEKNGCTFSPPFASI